MIDQFFDKIFSKLEDIDRQLSSVPSDQETEILTEQLLQLRRQMDQMVNYWLKFEEKVNNMQLKYKLDIPEELFDIIPDGLLEKLDLIDDDLTFENEEDKISNPGTTTRNVFQNMDENVFMSIDDLETTRFFRRGIGYFDLSMMNEAVEEFKNVIIREPNFMAGHFYLGMAYSELGNHEEALKEFNLILALNQNPKFKAVTHNCRGNIYAEQGRYEEALQEFENTLKLDNNFVDVYFNLGATCYNMNKFEESIEHFKNALKYFDDDWEIFYYLGKSYGNLGFLKEAIYYVEKASQLKGGITAIHLELGVLYELSGEKNKAKNQYSKIKNK
ncbi:tetratricopeptide repeat protein [Candidatus Contubernalis alkaliaceticus]|uniref:tetratricopeptide repeat protein n=1 Tax=Candidatus Contubernalis alkaliaceticus TaxID=338645 RepID=UPI001F4C4B37|nr:tetratricopeptide repeat protein [Candidatus Contubernalis alkalaceticus]UNC92440.1 tetratricopeptide repeat protein [Candidatus Contubernalis alkalaceticus]